VKSLACCSGNLPGQARDYYVSVGCKVFLGSAVQRYFFCISQYEDDYTVGNELLESTSEASLKKQKPQKKTLTFNDEVGAV